MLPSDRPDVSVFTNDTSGNHFSDGWTLSIYQSEIPFTESIVEDDSIKRP